MDIICPECGFHRTVSEDKLPARAQMATCPKCRHKFQFRELPDSSQDGPPEENRTSEPPVETNPSPEPEQPSLAHDLLSEDQQHEKSEQKSVPEQTPSPRPPSQKGGDEFWQGLQDLGQHQEIPEHEPVPGPDVFPPWENIRQYGLLQAFFQTLSMVLFHPIRFFQNMRDGRGLISPLIFYLIIVEVQIATAFFLQGADTVGISQGSDLLGQAPVTISPEKMLLLYPVLLACSQCFVAGLNHLFLNLTGGTEKTFEATFRVACYGSAPFIFSSLLPGAQFVAATWSLLCIILGYKHVHSITMLRSTLAVFFPLVLATLLLLLFIGSTGAV